MARQRNPLSKARLTGAAAHNPQRYRERNEPQTSGEAVGDPPSYLKDQAAEAWREMASVCAWLEREDRTALEAAAIALGQVRETHIAGEVVSAALLAALNSAIGRLGASPTDRGRIHIPADDEPEEDPFAQFDMRQQ